MTEYSPASRSAKAYAPSSPVVEVAITLPAASTSVTRASASGRRLEPARTTPWTSAPDCSAASTRVTPWPPISTGSASGRKPAALTATVTEPGTSSPKVNSPASPDFPVASTSPRTSVTMTMAPSTGEPPSAARTVPARPLVPASRMS